MTSARSAHDDAEELIRELMLNGNDLDTVRSLMSEWKIVSSALVITCDRRDTKLGSEALTNHVYLGEFHRNGVKYKLYIDHLYVRLSVY